MLGDTCDFDMNLSQPFAAATLLILAIQLALIGMAAVHQGVIARPANHVLVDRASRQAPFLGAVACRAHILDSNFKADSYFLAFRAVNTRGAPSKACGS
jgi:hypothetical protein